MGIPFIEKMIYPKQFPSHTRDISSEHHFYRRFEREMDGEQNVYYSVTLITPDVPMREIDFVVVSPYGIVCIELKNGRWKLNRGKWQFYNVREREWNYVEGKSYDGPVSQSSSQITLLKEFLKNHNGLEDFFPDSYYDAAIFFLKNNKNDFYLKDRNAPWIFGKEDLENESISLQEIINKIQDINHREPLDKKIIQSIHDVLVKNLNFISGITKRTKQNDERLVSLTKEQFSLISSIIQTERSMVFGVSGSGKSLLAGELSLKLSEQNQKTLIWQGSLSLYQLWKNEIDVMDERHRPMIIHNIEDIAHLNYEYLVMDQIDDWIINHDLKDLLFYIPEIFWKKQKWSLFLNRKLKSSSNPILNFLETNVQKSWDILRNIRNSPEIANFANLINAGDGGDSVLETLTDVQLVSMTNSDSIIEKLKWCFGYAKKILDLVTEDIIVLCPNEEYKTQNPELLLFLKEHAVTLVTLEEYSGLEESCGMILGFANWNTQKTKNDISEAVLHFRDLVCILYDEKEETSIKQALEKKGSGP